MAFSTKFDKVEHFNLTRVCGTNDCRCLYECEDVNAKGERLVVEVTSSEHHPRKRNSLMWHWLKNGWLSQPLERTYNFNTYVYDTGGYCYRRYDPTIKESEDGGRWVIDFDWVLEATPENAAKVFAETYRRFMAA